ncbi:FdtA/QdtA family cupin domain-containing protein [Proteus faecis]|uniref:FdtA/QdtA family cupin domain-containing protein n=1 Tax=Proteus faecis TaxID=2050967 RepID=A0AAW7CR16_9GAMM|nr:FdtA/QdtA family cupin domain-containing protein [Proteus faecis]MDL5167690.1 FdtA/QdtA family cupin domain-containing protein [Proteus faecis]MDL5275675.1 FdtA/QdtA family cupin domain-containing protein [Proteus faecis]MDL5279088.1 FdtA/QdtA family cupin domain-containing protein [Proteus faecis]MDL5308090.1 FdtA/QdtA family cupin domain-containing protein [Proteus faecis]MDL5311806.1 FdtA/QdtA family cupin domain-containing protein [Proteus faecis]
MNKLIKIINFKILGDNRGSLISLEKNIDIPFEIKRIYYIFDTKNNVSRGYHAHKKLEQIIICVKGSCKFILDNGFQKEEVTLNTPDIGLHIKNNIWREMHDFSQDCVLIVIASEHYDESDYIRDYDTFKKSITTI